MGSRIVYASVALLLFLAGCLGPAEEPVARQASTSSSIPENIIFVSPEDAPAAQEWQEHSLAMQACIHAANERLAQITSLGNCSLESARFADEEIHAGKCSPVFEAAREFIENHSSQFPQNGSDAFEYIDANLKTMQENLDLARDTRDYVCNLTENATAPDE